MSEMSENRYRTHRFAIRAISERDIRICGVALFFLCADAVKKISIYGVAVIANLTVCDGDGVSRLFLR